jgi:hypothetical protein
MDEGLLVEMRFDANARLVSPMRRFVEDALGTALADRELVWRTAAAAHELLENASKYARSGRADFSVTLTSGPEQRLTVRLRNAATPDDVDRLKQSIAALDGCGDLLEYYIGLMRRSARPAPRAGLGLARIRVECEMALGLGVEGDVVTLVARASVPGNRGPS